MNALACLSVLFATLAAFSHTPSRVAFFQWCMGVTLGCFFHALNIDFIGYFFWLFSTLLAMGLVIYQGAFSKEKKLPDALKLFFGVFMGSSFFGMIALAVGRVDQPIYGDIHAVDLNYLARKLVNEFFLETVLVCLILLVALVGCGFIARPRVTKGIQ